MRKKEDTFKEFVNEKPNKLATNLSIALVLASLSCMCFLIAYNL